MRLRVTVTGVERSAITSPCNLELENTGITNYDGELRTGRA